MKSTFTLLLCSLLIGCSTVSPKPEYRTPSPSAKVYKPTSWHINDSRDLKEAEKTLDTKAINKDGVYILDLKGGILDGTKQRGDGGQSETQEPLFVANIPLVVKNGFVRNNKNAAMFAKPNSGIEYVTFLNVGEDAVSTSIKAKNFKVSYCEFMNSNKGDKSIQLNQADGAVINNNIIYGGITGVRVHESSWANSDSLATCSKNTFIGTDTAWNVSKGILEVKDSNTYNNVRIPFKTSKGATIKNADGKVVED